jgi:hypothetical protein
MPQNPTHRITACLELVKMAADEQTLDNLLSAVEQEIASSSRRIDDASRSGDEWFHEAVTDTECDRIEQLLGWAFVAAQTFITTVRSRLCRLSQVCEEDIGKPLSFVTSVKAYEVLKMADKTLKVPLYTELEVINAVANYWKHQEEWPTRMEPKGENLDRVWDQEQMVHNNEKRTAEIITSIGMSPSSTGNLRTAVEAFGIDSSYEDLSPIRDRLRTWAESLKEKSQSEVESFLLTQRPKRAD